MFIGTSPDKKSHTVINIDQETAFCNGGDIEGHPGVYLDLSKKAWVLCPYCNQKFHRTNAC